MMWGAIKTALTGPAEIGKIVDGAFRGLDKLKYTSEEKADHDLEVMKEQAKIRLQAQAQVVEWMKATAPQAKMRRRLATLIAALWAVSFAAPIVMTVLAVWLPAQADKLAESAGIIFAHVSDVDGYMLAVVAFYLGAPHVATIMDGIVARKQGRRGAGDERYGDGA